MSKNLLQTKIISTSSIDIVMRIIPCFEFLQLLNCQLIGFCVIFNLSHLSFILH